LKSGATDEGKGHGTGVDSGVRLIVPETAETDQSKEEIDGVTASLRRGYNVATVVERLSSCARKARKHTMSSWSWLTSPRNDITSNDVLA